MAAVAIISYSSDVEPVVKVTNGGGIPWLFIVLKRIKVATIRYYQRDYRQKTSSRKEVAFKGQMVQHLTVFYITKAMCATTQYK